MKYPVSYLVFALAIWTMAACGGGGRRSATPASTTSGATAAPPVALEATSVPSAAQGATRAGTSVAPQTPRAHVDAAAALSDPCGLLNDADLGAAGTPLGPGKASSQLSGALDSRGCVWSLSTNGSIELRISVFAAGVSQPNFARSAVAGSAAIAKATVEDIVGIGDYAGVEIPPAPAPGLTADFESQKGSVLVSVTFEGRGDATWPTSAQLQRIGAIAAALLF